jgi:hypothetical protein
MMCSLQSLPWKGPGIAEYILSVAGKPFGYAQHAISMEHSEANLAWLAENPPDLAALRSPFHHAAAARADTVLAASTSAAFVPHFS